MKLEQIFETRRQRLRELVDSETYKGNQRQFAGLVGREPPNINQLLSGKRNMGEDVARDFEDRLDLPAYWFDGMNASSETVSLVLAMERLPADAQERIKHSIYLETVALVHAQLSHGDEKTSD